MGSPGGPNQVSVSIGGTTQPLQQALNQGAQALNQFGSQAQRAGQQAADGMGALQRQMQSLGAQQSQTSNSIGGELTPQVAKLNQAFGLLGVNLGAGLQGFLALDPEIAAIAIPVGLLFKGVTDLAGGVFDLGQKLVEIPFDLFQAGVEDSIRLVEQLTDRLAQLAEQGLQQAFSVTEMSEKNLVNWAFLWGGVDTTPGTPGYGTGAGVGPANELLQWSKRASLSMPFTRQDLMAAITTLSGEPGQSVGDIESHLSLISDIASTQGRPGITLNWAAMAALRGDQGQRRMLLYELKLTPEELAKYGYDENDNSTFYPALEAYAKARGSYGASGFISTNTFWGAETSAVDRLQNFGMGLMGWNDNPTGLADDVKKGSPFYYIKQDLLGLSKWFDDHQDVVQRWADLFGRILGGGLDLAQRAIGGLLDGLHKSGLDTWLETTFTHLGDFLNDPKTQQALTQIGEVIGGVLGPGIQDLGTGFESFMTALSNSGVGQTVLGDLRNFGAWLQSPEGKAAFQEFGHILGDVVGQGLQTAWDAGAGCVTTIRGFLDGVGQTGALDGLIQDLKDLGAWFRDPQHEEDLRHFGTLVGIWVGTMFQNAALTVKQLFDNIGNFITIIGDAAAVFQAWKDDGPLSEQYVEAVAKFGADYSAAAVQNQQNANQQIYNVATAFAQSGDEDRRHAAAAAGIAADQGKSGILIGGGAIAGALAALGAGAGGATGTTKTAYAQAGQTAATTYLASFKTTMDGQAPATMSTAVDAYTTGLSKQLKTAGSSLAQQLAEYVQQAVQQGIADALRNARVAGNAALRQPGGFRSGGIGLGGAL